MMNPSSDYDANTGRRSVQPDHGFRYLPLRRAAADGSRGRTPLVPLAEHLSDPTDEELRFSAAVWSGATASADELLETVAGGQDVGILVRASGLVVVDCDVKAVDGHGWVVSGGSAVRAELHRGIDDLRREVERLGHGMDELATYRARTKSGGEHLYFRQNPEHPLTSRHHRHDWAVDVIGSDNSWVAAWPSEGYEVLDARAPIAMPDWLAVFLYGVNQALPPLGGPLRREAGRVAAGALGAVRAGRGAGVQSHRRVELGGLPGLALAAGRGLVRGAGTVRGHGGCGAHGRRRDQEGRCDDHQRGARTRARSARRR